MKTEPIIKTKSTDINVIGVINTTFAKQPDKIDTLEDWLYNKVEYQNKAELDSCLAYYLKRCIERTHSLSPEAYRSFKKMPPLIPKSKEDGALLKPLFAGKKVKSDRFDVFGIIDLIFSTYTKWIPVLGLWIIGGIEYNSKEFRASILDYFQDRNDKFIKARKKKDDTLDFL